MTLMEILISAGAHVDGNSDGTNDQFTPLQLVLIGQAIATNRKSSQEMDATEIDMAKCLIQHKTNVNLFNSLTVPPLHLAVMRNSPEMVSVLLTSGAEINQTDSMGLTALGMACVNEYGNF